MSMGKHLTDPEGFDADGVEPDLDELMQEEYPGPAVPVRVTGPLTVHELPTRDAYSRTINVLPNAVEQIMNEDLRRKYLYVSARNQDIYVGHSKQDVADGICGILPAGQVIALPTGMPVYVRAATANPIDPTFQSIIRSTAGPFAAGAEASINGGIWLIRSVLVTLTTSAVVGNRRPVFVIDDGGANNLAKIVPPVDQPANTTVDYSLALGQFESATARAGVQMLALPNMFLSGRIRTVTAGLDAGDQYSVMQVYRDGYQTNTLPAAVSYWSGSWAD